MIRDDLLHLQDHYMLLDRPITCRFAALTSIRVEKSECDDLSIGALCRCPYGCPVINFNFTHVNKPTAAWLASVCDSLPKGTIEPTSSYVIFRGRWLPFWMSLKAEW